MSTLEGKIAVITGGSSGIGLATASASRARALTYSLRGAVKTNCKKPRRKSATTSRPCRETSQIWPTSIGSMRRSS